jgi:hypothetical protein
VAGGGTIRVLGPLAGWRGRRCPAGLCLQAGRAQPRRALLYGVLPACPRLHSHSSPPPCLCDQVYPHTLERLQAGMAAQMCCCRLSAGAVVWSAWLATSPGAQWQPACSRVVGSPPCAPPVGTCAWRATHHVRPWLRVLMHACAHPPAGPLLLSVVGQQTTRLGVAPGVGQEGRGHLHGRSCICRLYSCRRGVWLVACTTRRFDLHCCSIDVWLLAVHAVSASAC